MKLLFYHLRQAVLNYDYTESLDWDYFWSVEVPDWWYINVQSKWNNLCLVRWGRFILSKLSPDGDMDDEFPF